MARFFCAIDDKTIARADSGDCLIIQQGNPINDSAPDSHIYLDRAALANLRKAIDAYLTPQTLT